MLGRARSPAPSRKRARRALSRSPSLPRLQTVPKRNRQSLRARTPSPSASPARPWASLARPSATLARIVCRQLDSCPLPPWRGGAEAEQPEASRGAVQPARAKATFHAVQRRLVHPTCHFVVTLKIMSLNIGFDQNVLASASSWRTKSEKLFRLLEQLFVSYKPDIVCLSEVGGCKLGPAAQRIDLQSLLRLDLGSWEVACKANFATV